MEILTQCFKTVTNKNNDIKNQMATRYRDTQLNRINERKKQLKINLTNAQLLLTKNQVIFISLAAILGGQT